LDEWRPIRIGNDVHLVGFVYGHPHLRENARAITSAVQEMAPDFTWARTQNRVYQLGNAGVGPLPKEWAESIELFLARTPGPRKMPT